MAEVLWRMSGPPLIGPGAPKLRTIPPGADFLAELARAVAETKSLRDHPDALADDLIYVPNRRSARAGVCLHFFPRDNFQTLFGVLLA